MKVTQGTFSYLRLSDDQLRAQLEWIVQPRVCVDELGTETDYRLAVSIEFTDDPHPRNTYWDMWGLPMFDVEDPAAVMHEIEACRTAYPNRYIKLNAFDPSPLRQGQVLSLIVHRPPVEEKGYRLVRTEVGGQVIQYALQPYATEQPAGARYLADGNGR